MHKFFGQILCVSKCVFSSWSSCGLVCLVLDFWIVGNGETIDAWTSNWIARNLCVVLEVNIPSDLRNDRVVDLVDDNGEWNLRMTSDWLPMHVLQKIIAIVPPSRDGGDDVRCWPVDIHGEFSVSAAYYSFC